MQAAQKPAQWIHELPSREQQIDSLSQTPEYDMLVIGGGATGAGVAVDAGIYNKIFSSYLNLVFFFYFGVLLSHLKK